MIYICTICTVRKPSLFILSDEHRQILEAIVSPTLNLAKLNGFQLLICDSCKCLISTVETFKNIALVGTSHLLTRLDLMQKEQHEQLQPADPPLLPVKQDLDDLLQVKSFVEFEIEEEKLKPQDLEGDIKTECYDSDDNHSETSDPLTNPQEHACQANLPSVLETAAVEPAVSKPVVCMPTLVLHPLTVTDSSPPGDRPTDNLQLPTLQNETVKIPTLTLHPLTLSSSSAVDNNSEDNHKEKEELCQDEKASDLFLCRVCGLRVPLSRRDAHAARHKTVYCCHGCHYRTGDRADIVDRCDSGKSEKSHEKNEKSHEQSDVQSQGEGGDKPKRRRVRARRPPGPARCRECYARFEDETALAKHVERLHKDKQDLYVCEICKKEFKTKYKLNYHLARHRKKESQSVDTIKPELICAECGIQYQSKHTYNAHLKSLKHTPKDKWKFKCDTCQKMFFNNYALTKHINFVHLNKPDYQCSQCHKPFPRRYLLQQHVATIHEGKEKPRPHVCHVCGAAFTARTTLKEHLTTHSNVRPHACPLCPATFKFKAALYTHNRLKHLKIKGNWKKPKRGKEKKKKQKVDAESTENAIEIQSGR